MAGYLIPVALSSEIDDNGFEHIHAADSTINDRRILPLAIAGNIVDGKVDEVIAGSYTIIGGRPPYGDMAVVSGTFPSGLILATDGTYSGTLSTTGSYSWTVSVTDYTGTTATLPDAMTVTIGTGEWIAAKDVVGTSAKKSADGLDWSSGSFFPTTVNRYIAAGLTRIVASSSYYSDDNGSTWNAGTIAGTDNIFSFVYADGYYFASRRAGGLSYSTTGIDSWTTHIVGTRRDYSFAARSGLWVRGLESGRFSRSTNQGGAWSADALITGFSVANCYAMRTNGSRFIAGNSAGQMAWTDDAITWHLITTPFTEAAAIYGTVMAYGNGMWVAGIDGTTGQLAYSTDNGATFTRSTSTLGAGVRDIAFGYHRFIAVGNNGKMATSTDGINWVPLTNNFGTTSPIISIVPLPA